MVSAQIPSSSLYSPIRCGILREEAVREIREDGQEPMRTERPVLRLREESLVEGQPETKDYGLCCFCPKDFVSGAV